MASIIKSRSAHTLHGNNQPQSLQEKRSFVFHFEDVKKKADAYLTSVRQEAEKIVEQSRRQADQVRSQAQQAGRQDALKQAEKTVQDQVEQRFQSALAAIDSAVEQLRTSQQEWVQDWERRTLELSLAIAEKLVRRELRHAPDITVNWVREALDLAADADRIKVRLHPDDYQMLGERVRQLGSQLGKLARADVVSDSQVSPGGCVVNTSFGRIDQQLEAQLARIEEEFMES